MRLLTISLLLCLTLAAPTFADEKLPAPKVAPVVIIVYHQTLLDRIRQNRMDWHAREFERLQEARARAYGLPPRAVQVCPHCGKPIQ